MTDESMTCDLCQKVTKNRAGWVAHMRAHVRKGEAVETLSVGFWKSTVNFKLVEQEGEK